MTHNLNDCINQKHLSVTKKIMTIWRKKTGSKDFNLKKIPFKISGFQRIFMTIFVTFRDNS